MTETTGKKPQKRQNPLSITLLMTHLPETWRYTEVSYPKSEHRFSEFFQILGAKIASSGVYSQAPHSP